VKQEGIDSGTVGVVTVVRYSYSKDDCVLCKEEAVLFVRLAVGDIRLKLRRRPLKALKP
jgi:hypothetical protein